MNNSIAHDDWFDCLPQKERERMLHLLRELGITRNDDPALLLLQVLGPLAVSSTQSAEIVREEARKLHASMHEFRETAWDPIEALQKQLQNSIVRVVDNLKERIDDFDSSVAARLVDTQNVMELAAKSMGDRDALTQVLEKNLKLLRNILDDAKKIPPVITPQLWWQRLFFPAFHFAVGAGVFAVVVSFLGSSAMEDTVRAWIYHLKPREEPRMLADFPFMMESEGKVIADIQHVLWSYNKDETKLIIWDKTTPVPYDQIHPEFAEAYRERDSKRK